MTKVGMAVDGATKEKKKKKKVKLEDAQYTGDANVPACHDVSVQTVVKKEEPLIINIRDGEKRGSDAAEKKKKKKKKMKEDVDSPVCCNAAVQTTVKTESSDINISDAPEKTKKKKKKKIKEDAERIQEEGIVSEDGDHLVSKKKKAKKQGYEEEVEGIKKKKKKKEAEVKEEEADLGHCVEMVKKKKKKRKIDDVAEREQNTESADGRIKKKRKKQKEADACEGVEQKAKKKKKKKSSAEEEPDEISSKKKSKKLKKKLKSVDEGESRPHANGGQERPSDEKMKKKVKERTDDVIEIQEEPAGKKGRKDDRNKTPEKIKKKKPKEERHETSVERANKASDVVFLSAKPGNQDEVSIDQARRLALQRDIDMESQPEPNLGQWGTAQFDSSDRQAKFLRLMGGFKKSSQPLTGSSGQASMALGKEGQQTLQQGLLGEFERAQSRRMDFRNKGAGLGFAAPSNKKFAIDVNARNSVRFDD